MQASGQEDLGYWRNEGLDRLIAVYRDQEADDPFHATSGTVKVPYAPQIDDLVRLHRLARARMAQTVLEFGVGHSTIVLADALAKNARDFAALPNPPRLRNRKPFHLFTVDTSEHWLQQTRERLPPDLAARVSLSCSKVKAGTFNGRLCHYFDRLPNVVPDLIYLDGPSVKDVEGCIHGLDFSIDERTPNSADILLMESTLLPGTTIVIDGRVNNARFLERNFQRPFSRRMENDVTIFELAEPPLGRHSIDLAALMKRHRSGSA